MPRGDKRGLWKLAPGLVNRVSGHRKRRPRSWLQQKQKQKQKQKLCGTGAERTGPTLVRHVNRLIEPTSGAIEVLGRDISGLSQRPIGSGLDRFVRLDKDSVGGVRSFRFRRGG
jgi:hypothetical protein